MKDLCIGTQRTYRAADFVEAAVRIGDHLVGRAYWSGDRTECNWLGRRDIEDREIAPYSRRNVALSPELYSGTAGVALFLAELFGATGDTRLATTALAAWRRSVRYMETNDFPASPISFFAGDLGLIHAGCRLMNLAEAVRPEVEAEMPRLCDRLATGLGVAHSLDLIGGNAGAIPMLLALEAQLGTGRFRKLALDCAQEIVARAEWQGDLCYWSPDRIHGVELALPPLTGFSHGASGLAVGLLEAYQASGDEAFLTHARGAFAFEDSLFNPDERNWIDTRQPHRKKQGVPCGTFRGAWCHGAPGIGLAHLRASEIDRDRSEYHGGMARAALDTTRRLLSARLASPEGDATLCHGSLGLSDIVLEHGRRTGSDDDIAMAAGASSSVLELYPDPAAMPSGLQAGGYTPCLMVGLAGVGLHCLRQSDHSLPTVLLPASAAVSRN